MDVYRLLVNAEGPKAGGARVAEPSELLLKSSGRGVRGCGVETLKAGDVTMFCIRSWPDNTIHAY